MPLAESADCTDHLQALVCENNNNVTVITTSESGNHNNTTADDRKNNRLTSMQTKFIIVLLAVCNFFIANGVSLQGPFFPKEAGKLQWICISFNHQRIHSFASQNKKEPHR